MARSVGTDGRKSKQPAKPAFRGGIRGFSVADFAASVHARQAMWAPTRAIQLPTLSHASVRASHARSGHDATSSMPPRA
jgi:hypothetical protein